MCPLAPTLQEHSERRDWLDNIENFVAAQQRRSGEGVCQAQVGNSTRTVGKRQINRCKNFI